ncbi:MAG TPA: response regulator, partial [Gemmatimonadaceae bacterium]|nr:response regulator [Gemmatimonadaceae bacterium]
TVYGIVKQSDGFIRCDSVPGGGTTFTILLPRATEHAAAAAGAAAAASPTAVTAPHAAAPAAAGFAAPQASGARGAAAPVPARNAATVLVVEDEDAVRGLVVRVLSRHGYRVLEARDAREALAASAAYPDRIHLVLTDVIMPGSNGAQLARELTVRRPGIQVLLMSGYSDDELVRRGLRDPGTAFLQKPFLPDALVRAVGEAVEKGK